MRHLRWLWPLALVGLALFTPWACYRMLPEREIAVTVVDKTVPFENRIEHRSLFWLLDHYRVVKPGDGEGYHRDRDYLGAFPGPVPGDPPAHTVELDAQTAAGADLLYLADTYGVYEKDLESGAAMKAALERSPKIYGGLSVEEAEAARAALRRGATLIAEFNSMASPTGGRARELMEQAVGVRYTGWTGRFFPDLDDEGDVPGWMRRDYEAEWEREWEFTGPGYVLVREGGGIEVLRSGEEAERIGLTLERRQPVDPLLTGSRDGIAYPYWFDVVEARADGKVLASYLWHVTEAGARRLNARGLPTRFPAVVRRMSPGGGRAYYFAGDFADNPMRGRPVPLAGYPALRRFVEGARLMPSEQAFYWRFYVPMMRRLLEDVEARRSG